MTIQCDVAGLQASGSQSVETKHIISSLTPDAYCCSIFILLVQMLLKFERALDLDKSAFDNSDFNKNGSSGIRKTFRNYRRHASNIFNGFCPAGKVSN